MGHRKHRHGDSMVGKSEMPRSPGRVFSDCLPSVPVEADFDTYVEATCRPYDPALPAIIEAGMLGHLGNVSR